MRELDSSPLAIVGAGRLGSALAAALRAAGVPVEGPLGRGADGAGAAAVLLCVPDAQIAAAAAAVTPGPLVGHCSGASPPPVPPRRPRLGCPPAGARGAARGVLAAPPDGRPQGRPPRGLRRSGRRR